MNTVTNPGETALTDAQPARWRMPWVNAAIGLLALIGAVVMLYPSAASWVTQYYQSQTIDVMDEIVDEGPPSRLHTELERARTYNDALSGGAILAPESNVPTAAEEVSEELDYSNLLNATTDGIMGRLRVPAIKVDLPIYHGTSDETLTKGVGHLQGTSLPVGGQAQHSVLTAHRGYPSATLFNDLHLLNIGDTFVVEVFGEVLTFRVIDTQTVLPHETQSLFPRYGEDLMTLVTCTPLGINTHRYLVTGERVTPTPIEDLESAGRTPDIPGIPWWALVLGGVLVAYVMLVVLSGRPRRQRPRRGRGGGPWRSGPGRGKSSISPRGTGVVG